MDDKTIIRKAILDDLQDIENCAQQSFAKYIARIGKKPAPMLADYEGHINNGSVFVLEYENTLAGLVILVDSAEHVLLDTIAVYPSYQGKSLGKALLRFAENHTVQMGKSEVRVNTNEKMFENIAIYNHCGYMEYDRRCEDGYDRVFFRKKLA